MAKATVEGHKSISIRDWERRESLRKESGIGVGWTANLILASP